MQLSNFMSRSKKFWDWFADNEENLSELMTSWRHMENGGQKILETFSEGVSLISEDLKFHVGGDHEFVFSVSGSYPLFYLLPHVVAGLPEQYRDKWSFFPCMQGRGGEQLEGFVMHGTSVSSENVMVSAFLNEGAADLRFYSKEWESLDKDECFGAFFTMMDITVGEALANTCIGKIERSESMEDGMFPLTELEPWIMDNICIDGKTPDPSNRYFTYELTPPDNAQLRDDIRVGTTACAPLINEYGSDEPHAYEVFTTHGAKPVFLYYYYDGEADRKAILDERYEIMDKIEAEVLGERGSGNEAGLVLGGAMGDNRAYIDLLLYDEPAFMDKVRPILAAFPHMFFCKELHKDGQEYPLSDADVAEFADRLEGKLGKDAEEGAALMGVAAAEIVSIIEAIPVENRDYTTNSIFARCLNNCQQYQRALEVLDSVRAQGDSDYRWHYKRAYSLYFIDGREAEAEAELYISKRLAKEGDSLDATNELLEEVLDWKKRTKKDSSIFKRLIRRLKGLFGKKGKTIQVTYYTEEEMNAVEAFIEEQFGKYENIFHEIVSEGIHVDVCVIPPTTERNYYTIVTMGMGAVCMDVPEEQRYRTPDRAEVMLTLPPDWDMHSEEEKHYWPLRLLKVLARLPIINSTWLGWGHTISNEAPFAENTGLSSAMLLMPGHFGQRALKCRLPSGDEVIFYQVLPLYESEMNYKLEEGAIALLNCFPNDYDLVVDNDRPNYVEFGYQRSGNV